MSIKKFSLMMTSVGGEMSAQTMMFAQNSQRHDVRVVGVDASEKATGKYFADAFYTVPFADDPSYISSVLKIVSNEAVQLILPGSDEEALMLAKHRELFEKQGCQVACPDYQTLEILANKAETYRAISKIEGLNVPVWKEVSDQNELLDALDEVYAQCPHGIVLKPSVARGGRDILVISDQYQEVETVPNARELRMGLNTYKKDFTNFYEGKFPVVVMQRLAEPVHDIDMVSHDGRVIQAIPRRRVHSAAPNEGHILLNDPQLIKMAEIVIKKFNLSWLQDIDAMYDVDGTAYILEINPRPSGSFSISIAAGIPLLDDIISLAKGEETSQRISPEEKHVIPYKMLKAV